MKASLFWALVRFQDSNVQLVQALIFAVEEINRNVSLLPGVRLGYRVMDGCGQYPFSLRAVMSMISGGPDACNSTRTTRVIIGDTSSTQSMIVSRVLSPLHIPMVRNNIIHHPDPP